MIKIFTVLIFVGISICSYGQSIRQIDSLQSQINNLKEDKHSLAKSVSEVKERNDGRFEVLTWAAGIMIVVIIAMLSVNFYTSNLKAEDVARDTIDKKTEDIRNDLQREIDKIKVIGKEMENLRLQAETDFQAVLTQTETNEKLNDKR